MMMIPFYFPELGEPYPIKTLSPAYHKTSQGNTNEKSIHRNYLYVCLCTTYTLVSDA